MRTAALATGALAGSPPRILATENENATPSAGSTFAHLLDPPTQITVHLESSEALSLQRAGNAWQAAGCEVKAERSARGLAFSLSAPSLSMLRVHARWQRKLPAARLRILGDAWERSYGDLGWREVIAECPLPWYFLAFDGQRTHGYGVAVGASALAFWQCDEEGISLWLDVRNGGRGVLLGERRLAMATVVIREGVASETPLAAARAFCHLLSPAPRKSPGPIYGSNDWYYAYGNNTPAGILRDADLVAELAPTAGTRPFTIIDMGWEEHKFPDMAGLAESIRAKGVRPGIWVRPTKAVVNEHEALLLPANRFVSTSDAAQNQSYDPTIPEAFDKIIARVRQAKAWRYDLIKHDFSTYDLLGQWGFAMGASPTLPGWSFHDRSRTSAEIILGLYQAIRAAAGDSIVIGCNTIGHLGAGLFEAQRIGDDVSGHVWERTRRMGVNTLAFRLAQHQAFFCADADCVPFTSKIPWALTRQWLNLVANSGTALIVSPEPGAIGAEQKSAIRAAFAIAAEGSAQSTPLDWLTTHTPQTWTGATHNARDVQYEWLEAAGALPFEI